MASGDQISWGYTATRLDTAQATVDSAVFTTTETAALMSVTGFLTVGRRYKIMVQAAFSSTTVADLVTMRIRDPATTQIAGPVAYIPTLLTGGYTFTTYAEYTAAATGLATINFTGQRTAGAGNINMRAGASRPCWMTLDLIPV